MAPEALLDITAVVNYVYNTLRMKARECYNRLTTKVISGNAEGAMS